MDNLCSPEKAVLSFHGEGSLHQEVHTDIQTHMVHGVYIHKYIYTPTTQTTYTLTNQIPQLTCMMKIL